MTKAVFFDAGHTLLVRSHGHEHSRHPHAIQSFRQFDNSESFQDGVGLLGRHTGPDADEVG